ncbi:molybdenum cofactor guanylyltransferase [Fibrella aquatilis]|uniref:NTP transferase domain-containing protein n=1 Tax=Fibrella aquatilis TaxID=2817059 RepID=A0A939G7M2_9BACT|nr:NTP transferase domain-containing protein [Fibrella aquatilis]MBO0933694.1 NTP transferase domain-containing protein [Fibrella aquatilis]
MNPDADLASGRLIPLYGLVLMGGQSRRMGRDKSGIVYHQKPQREHLTDLLAPLCERVYWSVNQSQFNQFTYSHLLLDNQPDSGPLGGLVTAFQTYPNAAWLVVPCDLPNLDTPTLSALLMGRNPSAIATAFWDSDHRGPEPLVSLWEPTAGPLLTHFYQSGQRSPRRFLLDHNVHLLTAPGGRVFENVNE